MQTNDPKLPRTSLTCKGRALVAFNTNLPYLNFGRLRRDAGPQTKTVTITRGDGGPLSPEILPSKSPSLSGKLREIEPGEKYEVDVTISPPWPNDLFRANLDLATGLPDAPTEAIRVTARLEPRLQAQPSRFNLPNQFPEETELRVQLKWAGGPPGNVLSATTSDPALKVRLEGVADNQSVVLTVPAEYPLRARRARYVLVRTDDKQASTLRVAVMHMPPRRAPARPPIVRKMPAKPQLKPPADAPVKPAAPQTNPPAKTETKPPAKPQPQSKADTKPTP